MNIDKLTQKIFDECAKDGEPVTMAEAREMAELEAKSKKNCKNYVSSEQKTERKPRTVKISDEKIGLFNLISTILEQNYKNVAVLKENKLFSVEINGKKFKIDIIQERNK